jgi:hypothetical protein
VYTHTTHTTADSTEKSSKKKMGPYGAARRGSGSVSKTTAQDGVALQSVADAMQSLVEVMAGGAKKEGSTVQAMIILREYRDDEGLTLGAHFAALDLLEDEKLATIFLHLEETETRKEWLCHKLKLPMHEMFSPVVVPPVENDDM